VFLVRYGLGFYILEDGILHSHRRENLKSYMKNAVFWDVTLCGSCENRRFGRTYIIQHQGDHNQRARDTVNSNYQPKYVE
jgi:hypothetical protein